LDVHRQGAAGVVLVGGGEPAAAGPLEDVDVAAGLGLAGVRRHARDGGGDVEGAVAVEVGDGQGRRDELDLRGQRGDRAGEGEIAVAQVVGVPLEDGDVVADDVGAAAVVL